MAGGYESCEYECQMIYVLKRLLQGVEHLERCFEMCLRGRGRDEGEIWVVVALEERAAELPPCPVRL